MIPLKETSDLPPLNYPLSPPLQQAAREYFEPASERGDPSGMPRFAPHPVMAIPPFPTPPSVTNRIVINYLLEKL